MGQILRKFGTPVKIVDAVDISAAATTVIVKTKGAMAIDLHVEVTNSGGTADSNVSITGQRVHNPLADSPTVDDATAFLAAFNISAAGFNGAKKWTRLFSVDDHLNGWGPGVQLSFARVGGDRTCVISVWISYGFEVDAAGG